MIMTSKRLFITGGSGMVGQSLLRHPRADAWEIHAPNSRELDLRDAMAVGAYLVRIAPDVVVHCAGLVGGIQANMRSEEHTSELQSLMRISYAVFCLKKKQNR